MLTKKELKALRSLDVGKQPWPFALKTQRTLAAFKMIELAKLDNGGVGFRITNEGRRALNEWMDEKE